MKIYIIAWESDGGAGFNWYLDKEIAINAYNQEKIYAKEFKKVNWKAYYKTIDINLIANDITDAIDNILWDKLIPERKRK